MRDVSGWRVSASIPQRAGVRLEQRAKRLQTEIAWSGADAFSPDQRSAVEMIRVSSIVEVNAPAEVVFAYVRDPHNQSKWTPSFLELIEEPDGPRAPGTRYRGRLPPAGG